MAKNKFRYSEVGEQRSMAELGLIYSDNPMAALKEYVSNALDEIFRAYALNHGDRNQGIREGSGLVNIILSPMTHRVIVQDNALGMSAEKMQSLPIKVGESEKHGFQHLDVRGEKGVGLLAFASLGWQAYIISRTNKDHSYSGLEYEFNKKDNPPLSWEPLNPPIQGDSEMKKFGGKFQKGTQVVLTIDPTLYNREFKAEKVAAAMREIYWPILDQRKIDFSVRTDDGSFEGRRDVVRHKLLAAPKVQGEELIDTV